MEIIADLHIHSRYSMATSKLGTPEYLDLWARKKGISLVGTGDFTHPAWREELKEKLVPAESGLYRLRDEYVLEEAKMLPGGAPRFVITGEILSLIHISEPTRQAEISYAVFCLKKKKKPHHPPHPPHTHHKYIKQNIHR